MAGFLRRKNKQPATVNVVADTTTTTTTTKTKGGAPPLFARFATTATKSTDDVPRIVSSPMSLAASNRVGGGGGLEGGNRRRSTSQVAGNEPRGIVVTVPSVKPAPSRAPSLPSQSAYSLHSNTQRAASSARPPGPPPTYTTQHSAARAWRSSLVGLEDKPLPPNGNVGTSQPPSSPSSPPPPTRSLPLPPSSQSQSQQQSLNRPGLSAYTHNASYNASSQTLAPHASGSRLDTSDLRVSSRSSELDNEMEKEGIGGASGGELAPEFAMFQVSFRLCL